MPVPEQGDNIEALRPDLQYLGVPLVLKYVVNVNRWSIVPGLGVSTNFLLKRKVKATLVPNNGNAKALTTNNIEGLIPVLFSGLANVSFQYNLNKIISLAFQPTARFSLSSIIRNTPVKTNLNNISFGTGIDFKL